MDKNDDVSFHSVITDDNETNANTLDKSKHFQSCIYEGNETNPNNFDRSNLFQSCRSDANRNSLTTLDKVKHFNSCTIDGNETDANILNTTLEKMELKVISRLKQIHSASSAMDSDPNSVQFNEEDITDMSSTVNGGNEDMENEPSIKGRDRMAVLHYILHLLLQMIWLMMIPLLFVFISYLDDIPPSWRYIGPIIISLVMVVIIVLDSWMVIVYASMLVDISKTTMITYLRICFHPKIASKMAMLSFLMFLGWISLIVLFAIQL